MNKKNLLIGVLSAAFMATSAFAIAACDNGNGSGQEQEPTRMEKVYAQYVVYAQAEDLEPLSYEAWLLSIKGEKGDQGEQGIQGEKVKRVKTAKTESPLMKFGSTSATKARKPTLSLG